MARRPPRSLPRALRRDTFTLRIIGGALRGRRLRYDLDSRTRPMKDRIRQAIFNLIGPDAVDDVIVWDLFAGTGLLALEAISRGAARGVAIERTPQLAHQLRQHCASLDLQNRLQVVTTDTFRRVKSMAAERERPWLVFLCPPYAMFHEQQAELMQMIEFLLATAPEDSTLVVEFDDSFDPLLLPHADQWRTRRYRPTVIAWFRKVADEVPPGDLPPP